MSPPKWLCVSCGVWLLTACQVQPAEHQPRHAAKPNQHVNAKKIIQQLEGSHARDRIAAVQVLERRPRLAQADISMLLALLSDNRQVTIRRYIGAGGYRRVITSPAAAAAKLLSKLEYVSVIPLSLQLDDPNPVVRQYTIRALGIMANPEQASWFLSAIADKNPNVSKEAYKALAKQDPQLYIDLIKKLNMNSYSVSQRCLLIQLLGNSRDDDALPVLIKFANSDSTILRRASFVALENFPRAHLQALVIKGINDRDTQVQEDALLLAPENNSPDVMAAAFAQLSTSNKQERSTLLKVLPSLTRRHLTSVGDWQRWWQAYRVK